MEISKKPYLLPLDVILPQHQTHFFLIHGPVQSYDCACAKTPSTTRRPHSEKIIVLTAHGSNEHAIFPL